MSLLKSVTWNWHKKVFWRFIFIYLILYVYPYGFEYIHQLTTSDISFWPGITTWFGETFLGWEFNMERLMNGFDSKYDYSRFLLIALISLIGTCIWLIIDTKIKKSYNDKLKVLLQTLIRYHLGLTLIVYGLSKVLLLQFGAMDIARLETNMGDQNAMSFLWAFMSYSTFYTIIAGLIEVIGGLLLLYRRTTFLGAFILFIAMANVVLMDIGYDVRVKMFAIHLFFMALLLMSDHLKKLLRFFVTNKPTTPYTFQALFSTKKSRKIGYVIKGIILLFFAMSFIQNFQDRISNEKATKYPELASSHEVTLFVKNGDTIPRTEVFGDRWKKIQLNAQSYYPETMTIKRSNGELEWFKFEVDTVGKTLDIKPYWDSTAVKHQFRYKETSTNIFDFEGIYKRDTIWFRTKARKLKDYRLTKRKMRWITDF